MVVMTLPAEVVELPKGKKDERSTGKERDEAKGAPEISVLARDIAGHRVVGKIVGVGVRFARPVSHGSPRGPGEEGREPPEFLGVVDKSLHQTSVENGVREVD